MKLLKTIYFLVITLSLTGCGGGGGGGGKVSLDESADGIWVGFSNNSDITALYYSGKFATLNKKDNELYSGSYSIIGDVITSQDAKSYIWNGSHLSTGSIEGVVNSKSTILSTFTEGPVFSDINNPQKRSELVMYETSFSDKQISNQMLNGTWFTDDGTDNQFTYNVSIDAGNISVRVSEGCTIQGELKIPNNNLNIFELMFAISGSNCTYSGNYTGLGYLKDTVREIDGESTEVEVLTFAYSNDDYGFVYEIEKF
jgi:hypothetical protein